MYTCKFCLEEKDNKQAFASHLTKMHKELTPKERAFECCVEYYSEDTTLELIDMYINEEICVDELNKGGYHKIVDYLKEAGFKRSNSEEKLTDRYRKKYQNTVSFRYGEGVTNVSQLDWVQDKKRQSFADKHGSYENYLKLCRAKMAKGFKEYIEDENRLRETYESHLETIRNRWNVDNVSQISHVRELISNRAIARWENVSYEDRLILTSPAREAVCSRGGFESKIEQKVQSALIQADIDFDKHVHLFGYNFDLVIWGDLIIEVQGDMWHAHPSIYDESDLIMGKLKVSDIWDKDRKKKRKVVDNGYRVMYLWEHEINSSTSEEIISLILLRSETDECRNYHIH